MIDSSKIHELITYFAKVLLNRAGQRMICTVLTMMYASMPFECIKQDFDYCGGMTGVLNKVKKS